MVDEFKAILRFWLDLGVDGFRIDVAHGLAKDPALADLPNGADGHLLTAAHTNEHPHWDRDEVHEVYRGWRAVIDEYAGDRVFVAEAWVPNPDRFAQYLRADELHTAFNFNFLDAAWDAATVRGVIDRTLAELRGVGAPATWVLSNHDVTRHPTRFGGGRLGLRRAKAATLLSLALPGGAYVYQGEELGLEEVLDIPADLRQDPIFARTGGERVGRDGCRVPLPWGGSQAPFDFGPGGTPWLPQPAAWAELTVERQQDDPDSTLTFYRRALRARRENPALGDGAMSWIDCAGRCAGVLQRSRIRLRHQLQRSPGRAARESGRCAPHPVERRSDRRHARGLHRGLAGTPVTETSRCRTCREARGGVLRASLCTAPHERRAGRASAECCVSVPTDNVVGTYKRVTDLDRL